MKSIIVISEEPSLADTLISELPSFSIIGACVKEALSYLQDKKYDLVIIDDDVCELIDKSFCSNYLILKRPIKLKNAIFAINENIKSLEFTKKNEFNLGDDYIFSQPLRIIRSHDSIKIIQLTEKEADLLYNLLINELLILSRDVLLKKIWGYSDEINTHTLETHIYRLRSKIKQMHESFDITFSDELGYKINLNFG
ncbi:MAG: winged helix-turn-helix domain-containing protein [Pseudomonadota bacterium]